MSWLYRRQPLSYISHCAYENLSDKHFIYNTMSKKELSGFNEKVTRLLLNTFRVSKVFQPISGNFIVFPQGNMNDKELRARFAMGDQNMVGALPTRSGSKQHLQIVRAVYEQCEDVEHIRCIGGFHSPPAASTFASGASRAAHDMPLDTDDLCHQFGSIIIDLLYLRISTNDEYWQIAQDIMGRFSNTGNIGVPATLPGNELCDMHFIGDRKSLIENVSLCAHNPSKASSLGKEIYLNALLDKILETPSTTDSFFECLETGDLETLANQFDLILAHATGPRFQPQTKERPFPRVSDQVEPWRANENLPDWKKLKKDFQDKLSYVGDEIHDELFTGYRVRLRYISHWISYLMAPYSRSLQSAVKKAFPVIFRPTTAEDITGKFALRNPEDFDLLVMDATQNDQLQPFGSQIIFMGNVYERFYGRKVALLNEVSNLGFIVSGFIPDNKDRYPNLFYFGGDDIFDPKGIQYIGNPSGTHDVSFSGFLVNFQLCLAALSKIKQLDITPTKDSVMSILTGSHPKIQICLQGDNIAVAVRKDLTKLVSDTLKKNDYMPYGDDDRFLGHVFSVENGSYVARQSASNAFSKLVNPEKSLTAYHEQNKWFGVDLNLDTNLQDSIFNHKFGVLSNVLREKFRYELTAEIKARALIQEEALSKESERLEFLMKKYPPDMIRDLIMNPDKLHYVYSEADPLLHKLFSSAYSTQLIEKIKSLTVA